MLEELWKQNKGLIYLKAKKYAIAGRKAGLTLEDLTQTGFIALHDAAMNYDAAHSAFSTYLGIYLKAHMLRACGYAHSTDLPPVASLDAPAGDNEHGGVLLDTIEDKNAQKGFQDVLTREAVSCLRDELDTLPADERDAVRAVFFENAPRQNVQKPFLRGMRKLRNSHRLQALLEDYDAPIYRHISLATFNSTQTSCVERAAMQRESMDKRK